MTGPNSRPTRWVPHRWTANSTARIAAASGTTASARRGETTSRPSIADSTEIAGVITLSP